MCSFAPPANTHFDLVLIWIYIHNNGELYLKRNICEFLTNLFSVLIRMYEWTDCLYTGNFMNEILYVSSTHMPKYGTLLANQRQVVSLLSFI